LGGILALDFTSSRARDDPAGDLGMKEMVVLSLTPQQRLRKAVRRMPRKFLVGLATVILACAKFYLSLDLETRQRPVRPC
jgi:hypothetical protein